MPGPTAVIGWSAVAVRWAPFTTDCKVPSSRLRGGASSSSRLAEVEDLGAPVRGLTEGCPVLRTSPPPSISRKESPTRPSCPPKAVSTFAHSPPCPRRSSCKGTSDRSTKWNARQARCSSGGHCPPHLRQTVLPQPWAALSHARVIVRWGQPAVHDYRTFS